MAIGQSSGRFSGHYRPKVSSETGLNLTHDGTNIWKKIQVEVQGSKKPSSNFANILGHQHLIIRQSSSEIPNKNNEFH